MAAVLMVHRYYPDQIVVGWFFTMLIVKIVNSVLKKRIFSEFWLPIIGIVTALTAMLLFNKDERIVNDMASWWYMIGSIIGAISLLVIIKKLDKKR